MSSAIRSGAVSPKTVKRYMVSIQQLAPYLDCDLSDITVDRILDIVERRKAADKTHATIKRDLSALASVLGVAIARRWMPRPNPVRAFFELNKEERGKIVREVKRKIVLPRPQDIVLLKSKSSAMWGWLMDAAMKTGAREDELIKLELDHIDYKYGRLTIYGAKSGGGGKRDRTRTIDLKVMAGTALFGEIPRYLGSPYVFWHDDGEPFTNFFSHFHRKVKAIARWAKANGVDFRPFTFHSLRHWHAIEFLRSRSGTLHELQFRLGHSTIKTTEEYINSGLLSAEEVQWALFGGHSHGLDFSSASGHKSGHNDEYGGSDAGRNALI
jgi:integrase/recombinase XerD